MLWALYWVLVLSKRERTDDAYVNGNKVVHLGAGSGTVIAVLTDDTQLVHAGAGIGAARSGRCGDQSGARGKRAGADRPSSAAAALDCAISTMR